MFLACCFLSHKTEQIVKKQPLYVKLACVLFSIFMVAGDSFKKYGSFWGIFGNPFKGSDIAVQLFEEFATRFNFLNGPIGNLLQFFSAFCKGIGYYFIIKHTIALLLHGFRQVFLSSTKETKLGSFADRFFSKRAFLRVFVVLIIAWLPYLIIKIPVSVSVDAMSQLNQFSSGQINTHHPFFTCLLFGGFASLGSAIGSRGIGLFLYILLHYNFMAAVFSYCIVRLHRISERSKFSLFILGLFAFSPSFPSFATTVIKDSLYCTLFVLFVMLIIELLYAVRNGNAINKPVLYLVLVSIFLCLVRNNGIYIVIPTLISIGVWLAISLHRNNRRLSIVLLLLLPIVFYIGFNSLQYDVLNLKKGSIKEALSIPFQQTARFVKEHPEDITAEDAEIIDRVLNFENLDTLYNPIVSDPVKSTYKEDSSALKDYFFVWWKHLKLHPGTYIEATVHTNYFAFYPDEPNIRAYMVLDSLPESAPVPILNTLRIFLLAFTMGLSAIPIISSLINPVFYIWIFLLLLFRFIARKKWSDLLLLLPMFIQLLTVIAGPAVFNHPRYIYPIYWSIPFVLMYLLPPTNQRSD